MSDLEQELLLQAERLEAIQACRNLMGKYSYYHTAFRNKDYMKLWIKRDDCLLVMPFGKFYGYNGVYRCYAENHGDRSDPDFESYAKGLMMMHQMDTEVIEVAADGKTAKGCWISPGHETSPAPGKEKGAWSWGKYYVEFMKDEADGKWKFWKLRLYPLFLMPVDHSWAEPAIEIQGRGKIEGIPMDAPLDEPPYEYAPDRVYPADEPEPPKAYESYPSV